MRNDILKTIDRTLEDTQLICQRSGYSLGAIRVLNSLYRCAPQRTTELAARVNISQQAVGKLLIGLGVKKLVIVNQDAYDGRARMIDLTSKGYKAISEIEKVWR